MTATNGLTNATSPAEMMVPADQPYGEDPTATEPTATTSPVIVSAAQHEDSGPETSRDHGHEESPAQEPGRLTKKIKLLNRNKGSGPLPVASNHEAVF